MMKNIALSRPATSAIAAFLVLSTPAAFAQDASPVQMAPPVVVPTVQAPSPAPVITAPAAAQTAPQPVIRVPLDIQPKPTAVAAKPKAAAAPARSPRAVARQSAPQPAAAPVAERTTATPVAAAAATLPAEGSVPAAPVIAPTEVVTNAAPAPVAAAKLSATGDSVPWDIVGGAAALLIVGGAGLAFARRRRATREVWEYDEPTVDAEWVPGAATSETTEQPQPVMRSTPTFAAAPSGSMGRHEAMAMAGPTPDNPFATLSKRLARARFLDRQERVAYDATLAEQKDLRRKPVSAWEIAQRTLPEPVAEQEVRRPEPGRERVQTHRPGLARG